MNPSVNYLRVWRSLCELPKKDGPRTHWPTLDQIAEGLENARSTVRKLFASEPSTVKTQRSYAARMLDLPQPEGARVFLAGVAAGAPDDELQRLEAAARAGPLVEEWPFGDARLTLVAEPEPRPMSEKLLKCLAGVDIPVGLKRGERVLLYARQDVVVSGRFVVDQGEAVTMGISLWKRLRRSMPGVWRSLELISEPSSDYIRQARHLSFANLGAMPGPAQDLWSPT